MIGRRKRSGTQMVETSREEIMAKIATLRRRGYSQIEIGREMGLTQQSISQYEAMIREKYRNNIVNDIQEIVNEMVAGYEEVMKEAWEAWERSKEDGNKNIKERVRKRRNQDRDEEQIANGRQKRKADPFNNKVNPKMMMVKVTNIKEGRLPKSDYLKIILDCRSAIRELRGIDAPKKVDLNHKVMDWTALAKGMPDEVPDEVEERIKKVIEDNMTRGAQPVRDSIVIGEVIEGTSEDSLESVDSFKPSDLRQGTDEQQPTTGS